MTKPSTTWNLDDVLKLEDYDALYNEIEQAIPALDAHYKKLTPEMSVKDFKEMLLFDEDLTGKIQQLFGLPGLMEATDTTSQQAQLLTSRASNLAINITSTGTNISQWVQGKKLPGKKILDDRNAKRLFNAIPDLTYPLENSRNAKKTFT